ncbi:MAG: HAD family hydrolase [Nitrospinota bacterium]
MFKAILFDFGGTLDSDGVHWVDQFRAAYEAAGYTYATETFNAVYFDSDRRIRARYDMRGKSLLDLLNVQVDLIHEGLGLERNDGGKAKVVRAFEARATRILTRNRDILAGLAKRYRLGVVSNFCGNLDVICREYSLAGHLSVIVDSFIAGVEKPDAAIFCIALERLGVQAGEAVFVGDNLERDIKPAQSLGMQAVWLRGSHNLPPPEVDRTIESLTELEEVL